MKMDLAIAEFAKTLAGVYDNIEQSQQNPKDFASFIFNLPFWKLKLFSLIDDIKSLW